MFGTRPEAIKMAPLVHALRADGRFEPGIVVTAQHREMLDQVLDCFGITADVDLDLMTERQTLADLTARALQGLGRVIAERRPAAVAVQGDTTTTFCGALAAFYEGVPIVHLEAGLRTGDVRSPFPEEMNRRLVTRVADLHLAPTETARRALLGDGVDPGRIVLTGNTVIDALLWTVDHAGPAPSAVVRAIEADPRRVVLVTAHRRESFGAGMAAIAEALVELASDPALLLVVPLHRNPNVGDVLGPALRGRDNVVLTEPLGYRDFVAVMRRCELVLTDSGGVQEEAPSLGKPVLVLRDNTERPDAVTAGTARLVGTDTRRIVTETRHLLDDPAAYAAMANATNPYGDGTAAARSIDAIAALLGVGLGLGPGDEVQRSSAASASSTSSRRMPNTNRIASR